MNPIELKLFENAGFSRKEIKELKRQRNIRALEDYVLRKVTLEQELKLKNPTFKLMVVYLTYYGMEDDIDNFLEGYSNLETYTKFCPVCDREFKPGYYNKKYCSRKCRRIGEMQEKLQIDFEFEKNLTQS